MSDVPAPAASGGPPAAGAPDKVGGPFSPVMSLALVLVGVFSFAALVVLSTFAPELASGNDGGGHALSKSAIGYAGMVALLKAEDEPVLISRGPVGGDRGGVLVLTPPMEGKPAELDKISFKGPILIVLPKWFPALASRAPGWTTKAGQYDPGHLAGAYLNRYVKGSVVLRASGVAKPVFRGADLFEDQVLSAGPVENLQTLTGPGWTPELSDGQGRAVLAHLNDTRHGDIYVLADPDLINTHGIADLATARVGEHLLQTLRAGDGPFVFDVTLYGYKRDRSLLRQAFAPPFLAMTLCLVFTALLMGLHAFARFGPARRTDRAFGFGKQALADNTAAMIRMAKREHRMAGPYVALTRAMVARAVTAPRDMDDDQLDAFLDRLGEKANATSRWSDLIARAGRTRDPFEMVAVARELYRWRREMTRDT